MTFSKIISVCALTLTILFQLNTATAAGNNVFKNKTLTQHELTDREQNRMDSEFSSKFSKRNSANNAKVGGNPWAAKKSKNQQHRQKMLQLSNSWGHCREFSFKQRGHCYARGGDAYTCERYYDARVNHCDENF